MGLPPAMNERWFELSDRRRRLRSGSRLLTSLNEPSMDNAATQMPQHPYSEPDDAMYAAADADYELFLEHLRPHGRSYVFEMAVGGIGGSPLRLVYEAGDDCGDLDYSLPSLKVHGSVSRSNAGETRPRERGSLSPHSGEVSDPCFLSADEDYLAFLKHVRAEGGAMVLELGNDVTLRYEEGEREVEEGEGEGRGEEERVGEGEEETDDEQEAQNSNVFSDEMELQPFCGLPQPSDSSASQLDRNSLEILEYRAPSRFSWRLKNILKKPFNQREYDNLIALATVRRPVVKHKHLRDKSVPYETKIPGFSYLDHYPDLARQIECADSHRGLVLLRGFFFWLKNVGHDGAFMPWVVPTSSIGTLLTGRCSL